MYSVFTSDGTKALCFSKNLNVIYSIGFSKRIADDLLAYYVQTAARHFAPLEFFSTSPSIQRLEPTGPHHDDGCA